MCLYTTFLYYLMSLNEISNISVPSAPQWKWRINELIPCSHYLSINLMSSISPIAQHEHTKTLCDLLTRQSGGNPSNVPTRVLAHDHWHGNSYLGVYVLNILIQWICVACLRVFIYLCVQVYQVRIFGSTWPREHAAASIIGLSSIRIEIQLQCVKTQTLIQDAGVAGKWDRYYRVEATELQNLQKCK